MSDEGKKEFELFDGFTFSDLMSDIYNNSTSKHRDIKSLVDTLSSQLTTDNAEALVPLIKEYLEIDVKNDEMLVKLASIVQRHLNNGVSSISELGGLLSAEEKKQLDQIVAEAQEAIDDQKPLEE